MRNLRVDIKKGEDIKEAEHKARKEQLKRSFGEDYDKMMAQAKSWWNSPDGMKAVKNAKYAQEVY